MGDMAGKVVLITGATNGIGRAAALALAHLGAHVVIAGRSEERARTVASAVRALTRNANVDYLLADLTVMPQVRDMAETFRARCDRLDVLVNNAGALFMAHRKSADGFEMTFALNHLSHFLLTALLLDVLKATAQRMGEARIINVSSDAHMMGKINFDRLGRVGKGFASYSQTKLMNVLFTYELARRLEGTGVTANAVHPGFVASGFGRNNGPLMNIAMLLTRPVALSPEKGAETVVWLASSPGVRGVTGRYFVKKKAVRSAPISYDQAVQRRLWEMSETLLEIGAQATKA